MLKVAAYCSPGRRNRRREHVGKAKQKWVFILFQTANSKRVQGQRQQRSAEQTGGESDESESASAATGSTREQRGGGRAALRHTATGRGHTALQKNMCNLQRPELIKQGETGGQWCDFFHLKITTGFRQISPLIDFEQLL